MLAYQNTGISQLGNAISELYKTNPVFKAQDQFFGYWFDQYMHFVIQCYYWPMFVVGISDNVQDLFNPKTYSICK